MDCRLRWKKRNLKQFNIRLQHKTNMKQDFCKMLYNAFVLFVNYNIYKIIFYIQHAISSQCSNTHIAVQMSIVCKVSHVNTIGYEIGG